MTTIKPKRCPDLPGRYLATDISKVAVDLVWEPCWEPEMMSERGRRELDW